MGNNIYSLYRLTDDKGNVIEGTRDRLCDVYGFRHNLQYSEYVKRGVRLYDRWKVENLGKVVVPRKPRNHNVKKEEAKPVETESQKNRREMIEASLAMIKEYGNYSTAKEYVNDIIEYLKQNGYEVACRQVDKYLNSKPFYVLERI